MSARENHLCQARLPVVPAPEGSGTLRVGLIVPFALEGDASLSFIFCDGQLVIQGLDLRGVDLGKGKYVYVQIFFLKIFKKFIP